MKKNIFEESQRMIEIMGKVQESKLLAELNVQYLDQLLDKINDTGMESLSDYEKEALQKLSNNQDVQAPEKVSLDVNSKTLRFSPMDTRTGKPMAIPNDAGDITGEALGNTATLTGEAAQIAGSDTPMFIDGDLAQLDKPAREQEIRMYLPDGEYECLSIVEPGDEEDTWRYEIMLKPEEEDDEDFDLGEMEDYTVTEAWDKDVKIEKTGEHAGKTVEELRKQLENLKKKSKTYQDKGEKVPQEIIDKEGELKFAIRAKTGWKKKMEEQNMLRPTVPFKNNEEGDAFRKWFIEHFPKHAKRWNFSPTGPYNDQAIIDAFNLPVSWYHGKVRWTAGQRYMSAKEPGGKMEEEEMDTDFSEYNVSETINEQEDRRAFFGDILNSPEGDVKKVGEWYKVQKLDDKKIYYVLNQSYGSYGDMSVAVLDENYNQVPMDSVPEIINMLEKHQYGQ